MNRIKCLAVCALAVLGSSCIGAYGKDHASEEPAILNNEAVRLMKQNEYSPAIDKLKAALEMRPDYVIARENLSTAYNNLALSLVNSKPAESIKWFHQALYTIRSDRARKDISARLDYAIAATGRDPKSGGVRMELGNEANSKGDLVGALIEYQIAEHLNVPAAKPRLAEVRTRLKHESKGSVDGHEL